MVRGEVEFAVVGPFGVEIRLDRQVAAAATRTPDTAPSPRDPDWVRFNPRELDAHALDRLQPGWSSPTAAPGSSHPRPLTTVGEKVLPRRSLGPTISLTDPGGAGVSREVRRSSSPVQAWLVFETLPNVRALALVTLRCPISSLTPVRLEPVVAERCDAGSEEPAVAGGLVW